MFTLLCGDALFRLHVRTAGLILRSHFSSKFEHFVRGPPSARPLARTGPKLRPKMAENRNQKLGQNWSRNGLKIGSKNVLWPGSVSGGGLVHFLVRFSIRFCWKPPPKKFRNLVPDLAKIREFQLKLLRNGLAVGRRSAGFWHGSRLLSGEKVDAGAFNFLPV